MKKLVKIGWFMYGPRRIPGARIQGWNMHEYFLSKGINSKIIFAQENYNTNFNFTKNQINNFLKEFYDIIIVHKIEKGKNFHYFVNQAHKKRIKVVFIGLDDLNIEFASLCDGIIVVSKYLKTQIPKNHKEKVYLVFDSYEHNGKTYKKHSNKKRIKLVFVSTHLYKKFPYIDQLPKNVSLTVISHPKKRLEMFTNKGIMYSEVFPETKFKFNYVEWNENTVKKEIIKCDVALIPIPKGHLKAEYIKKKSSNRLILFMSLGMPTIASPTPEYNPLIKQGRNGFLAKNPKEWIKYIEYLRDNPKERARIGKTARKDIVPKYSKESQGKLYLKIFEKVLKTKNSPLKNSQI